MCCGGKKVLLYGGKMRSWAHSITRSKILLWFEGQKKNV